MLELSDICQAWELPAVQEAWTPASGTIHQTLLLRTSEGRYALRAYRYTADERQRIVNEHALIAYVYAQGRPVPVPLPLADGTTILAREGRFYALFPFAVGEQVARQQLTTREALAMGTSLGELHQALRAYPQERVTRRDFVFDQASVFAMMDAIEAAIHALPERTNFDARVLARLAERRAWLASVPAVPPDDFFTLEWQVIHGDYQETNLFFAAGQVSAVIDWDQAYTAPRAWEVVRVLHYAFKLQSAMCRAFLAAYRRVQPLTSAELEIAAAAYGWKRAHDLWHYKALYLEGNQRVRAFLQPTGPYIPFERRWTELRTALRSDV